MASRVADGARRGREMDIPGRCHADDGHIISLCDIDVTLSGRSNQRIDIGSDLR